MAISVPPDGPVNARILIVGEAPGADEEALQRPFVGASGAELCRMLSEAGIRPGETYFDRQIGKPAVRWLASECRVTNLCRERPPGNDISLWIRSKPWRGKYLKEDEARLKHDLDPAKFVPFRNFCVDRRVMIGFAHLQEEIRNVNPGIIITVGNSSLWALTGHWGITKWRGSMLIADQIAAGNYTSPNRSVVQRWQVLPTYHPAAVLRQWSWRAITVADLRRAARFRREPFPLKEKHYVIRPTFEQASLLLQSLLSRMDCGERLRLSFDLETRVGHTACAGVSWSLMDALCIPLMCAGRREGYWKLEEEAHLMDLLHRVLTHFRADIIGQNLLYDCQYTHRHWHYTPRVVQDTMISQHSIFSDLPKALAFQASMYCDSYVFWKDDGKNWEANMDEGELWYYNCDDCVNTDEVGLAHLRIIEQMTPSWPQLPEIWAFQQKMFWPVLRVMQRGVRIDHKRRNELILEVQGEVARRQQFLLDVLGFPLNPESPKQMHALFYSDFGLPVQMKKGKKGEPSRPTLDDDALNKLARFEPLVKPLVNAILDIRTLHKFLSNFLLRSLDIDGRMRCSFNIGGSESGKSAPKTYRLSSSEDAFGSGANLQVIPSEKSKSLGKAAARGGISGLGDPYQFPNIREIFIPDPDRDWFDLDLERADLFVVCWEANDEQLKAAMRLGADIHLLNSFVITGREPPPLEELVESHAKYRDHRGPMKLTREFAKVFCHGTNYLGQPKTMAAHTGRTIHEIDRAQKIWFGAHPGIKRWHKRTIEQVTKYRFVENKFGYRWFIFDRLDSVMAEAVSWVPQSTVSIVINKIWERIDRELYPDVEVLLQVHDSLPGQLISKKKDILIPKIRECAKVVVPYDDPLVIPVSIKTSDKSWGHC